MKKNSIRLKVALSIFALTIILGGLSTLGATYYSQRVLLHNKNEQLIESVSSHSYEYELILKNSQSIIKALSSHPQLLTFFHQLDQEEDQTVQKEEITKLLRHYNIDDQYSSIYIMDADGLTLAATDPQFVDKNYGFRSYFQTAIQGGSGFDTLLGVTSDQVGIYISYPIYTTNDQILGVIVGKVKPEILDNFIGEKIHSTETDNLELNHYIVDQYGVILMANDKTQLFHSIVELTDEQKNEINKIQKYSNREIKSNSWYEVGEILENYQTAQTSKIFEPREKYSAISAISQIGNYPLYIIIEQSTASFQKQAVQFSILIGGLFLLTSIIIMILIILIIQFISKPLRQLTEKMSSLTDSEAISIKDKFETKNDDEIGQLAKSYNKLIDLIISSRKEIYNKVEEQTKEIVEKQQALENQKKAVINILEDVEEERANAQALAQDLVKFKLATDYSSNHIVFTDKDSTILYANAAAEKITGFSIKEIIGKKIDDTLWGGLMDKEFYKKFWKTIAHDKQIFSGEMINKRKNGEKYYVDADIIPILDEEKEVEFYVGIERDITQDKKQIEIANKLAAIVKDSQDAIVSKNMDGIITSWNQGAEQLYGYTKEEVVGKSIGIIIPGDKKNKEKEIEEVANKIKKDQSVTLEKKRVKKDGTIITVSITGSPIKDDAGIITGVSVIARDISREKEVDRMKTEFISLASHQLRTPLSAIKWFLEMLLNGDAGDLSDEQKEYVTNIDQSNERMIELVNSLLNISRIESGRIIVEPKSTDLVSLLKDVLMETEPKVKEKSQKIETKFPKDLKKIKIDPNLIRQAYLNIITNAIKYSPDKSKISVAITENKTEIITKITDQGIGIPKKDHEKVFSKFFRSDNVAKMETDGNGLGLYLVKAIIDSSAGKIWFETKENKGTSFYISLPKSGSPAKKGEVGINN